MNKHLYYSVILLFIIARMILSLVFSDRTAKSDSVTYIGLAVNIEQHSRFASIQPDVDLPPGQGVELDSLYTSLSAINRIHERLLPYQWLHVLVYLPLVLAWTSMIPVIILNNLLFACAGYFFLFPLLNSSSVTKKITGWGMYLFFPPFFYLTYQFFSEPLFFLLLGIIVYDTVYRSTISVWTIVSAVAIGLTRPYGLIIVGMICCLFLSKKEYRRATVFAAAIVLAVGIEWSVERATPPYKEDIPESTSFAQILYYSNTIHGNGDADYFGKNPSAEAKDSLIAGFLEHRITGGTLITGLLPQIVGDPLLFAENMMNKIGAYFFNIIPNSWTYSGNSYQSLIKRMLWAGTNYLMLYLVIGGISVFTRDKKIFFWCFFITTFLAHILLIARYRYFMPVIAVGMPMAVEGLWLQIQRYTLGQFGPPRGKTTLS